MNKSIIKKRNKLNNPLENIMGLIFFICGLISILSVIFITVYMFIAGTPAINKLGIIDFIFGQKWDSTGTNPTFGIMPFILTSIWGTLGAIIIGVPIGLFTAIYLSKIANNKVANILKVVIELLAGIPSVVYGLIGMMVLVPFIMDTFNLPSGATLFAAIIVLAIMILPSIITISETALLQVLPEYEEASLALGANKIETIFKVSIPAAKSGIIAGIVLGIGRAIGEATAVMMVAGNVANMPGLFKSVRFLTTAVSSEMSYASFFQEQALFSIALVLYMFILIINGILNKFIKVEKR